jgi:hypothetical protein
MIKHLEIFRREYIHIVFMYKLYIVLTTRHSCYERGNSTKIVFSSVFDRAERSSDGFTKFTVAWR